MAIERMKFLSMMGNENILDFVIANDLIGNGFQPENALKVLEKGWKLTYFTYDTTIKEYIKKAKNLVNKLDLNYEIKDVKLQRNLEDIEQEIDNAENRLNTLINDIDKKEEEIKKLEESIEPINHLKNVPVDLQNLYDLKYMRFRFGKISKDNYEQLISELDHTDAVIVELDRNENEVWIIYFTPDEISEKVDSYFKVMKFERVWLPKEIAGKPSEVLDKVEKYIENSKKEIESLKQKLILTREENGRELLNNLLQLEMLEKINKVKKYMAHDDKGSFYIVGWIPTRNLKEILLKLEKDNVEYVVKNHDEVASTPPTKLKNNRLIRPFESIVNMYGIPNYTEMDPTWFVALTAFIMFGFMFGDIGHGLVVTIVGIILAKRKSSLGPVLTAGGISSIIFGFLYGSIFGKEDIIKGILPSPMDNITNMLIAGIATGAVLIIIAMIFNIKNGIKNKDTGKIFFDKNGLAGLIFYTTILVLIVGFLLKGKMIISLAISTILILIPLILILFKEKLENLIKKDKNNVKVPVVEKIFELIEMLLSMASNTISFVRLAAFAINHVGLCMAVYILADMFSGAGSIAVAIIGNIIVIALEGLIVAIQVLRLEYYELFSRFYTGDGKEYIPIENQK